LINLWDETQWIPKGTELGILHEAQVLDIPEDDDDDVPRVSQIKDASPDPDTVNALENPMINWIQRRRDGMRGLGEQYRDTLAKLGILDKTLLVQIKATREESRLDWCVDCRGQPDNVEISL